MASAVPFLSAYLVLVGMMVGSFINLAADRLPRRESIVRPRSHCRACNRQLNTIDLLPVIGYVIRRGRCASCGTPIGAAAPKVEATCGAGMAAAIAWLGVWRGGLVGLALIVLFGAAVIGLAMRRPHATEART